MIGEVKGTIVECNTAYEGKRNTTEAHWETMKLHGWTEIAKVDIMDEEGEIELPVALDQACVDFVYQSDDKGKVDLIERIESRNGIHTVEAAANLGFGNREYEIIKL